MTSALIAVALGALALAAAWAINRRRPTTGPSEVDPHIPTRLDRVDFPHPDVPALVAVFTSATCASCAAMLATARGVESEKVAVAEVEAKQRADLHARYSIDAVPVLAIADGDGVVRASFAGEVSADDLRAALLRLH